MQEATRPQGWGQERAQLKIDFNSERLASRVDLVALEYFLRGYDSSEKNFILTGFRHGFSINYFGPRNLTVETPNHLSATDQPRLLWDKIMKEVDLGHVAGPFKYPPFEHYFCSPLGLVRKACQPGKFRMIFDLSAGKPTSVYEQVPDEYCSVQYNDFDQAITLTQQYGVAAKIGKTDLEAAFRQVLIRREDWHLLVFKAENPEGETCYFFDKSLPFGSAASCQIYQWISNALAWAQLKKTGKPVVNYLDDFFFADGDTTHCNSQIVAFHNMCEEIGLPVSQSKTEWAAVMQVFLGLLIHAKLQLIVIPREKVYKCIVLVDHFLSRRKATVKQLMCIAGTLNFVCRAINYGRTFLRALYNQIAPVHNKRTWHLRISKQVKDDLRLWKQFLLDQPHNKSFLDLTETTAEEVQLFTDASGSNNLGFGCYLDVVWIAKQWPSNFVTAHTSTCFLELFAVTVAIVKWAHLFTNKRILLHCDNQATVAVVNAGTSRCTKCLQLLKAIAFTSMTLNVRFRAKYIHTKDNGIADSLSCLQFQQFFQLAPEAQRLPAQPPAAESAVLAAEIGLLSSTRAGYIKAYRMFIEYVQRLDPIPTRWETAIEVYRGHLIERGLQSSTIASYIAGIRSRLQLDGVVLHENEYAMKQMHRAAKKRDVQRIRKPVSFTLLSQALDRLQFVIDDKYELQLFKAIFVTAYYGMFRIGELVESEHAIKLRNVLGDDDRTVHLIQHSSKVMKPGQIPLVVEIKPRGTKYCPCKLLNLFTVERARIGRRLTPNPSQFFVHENGSSVTKCQVLRMLRKVLQVVPDCTETDFGTHSFRSGRATDLWVRGHSEDKIKKEGKWCSKTFKKYIKV